jgi:hypothetical protein
MTATHWIAIAAITTPFATSWLQFWLKQRSENAKLAIANPATAQPTLTDQLVAGEISFWGFLKKTWQRIVLQWGLNLTAVVILIWQYKSDAPLTRHSVVLVALTATFWAYISLIMFILDLRSDLKT